MPSKLAPFLIGSLLLHIGLVAVFQIHKRATPPPPIKPTKALVHTVYLKPEAPKKIAALKPEAPKTVAAPKPATPKPQAPKTIAAQKPVAPKPVPKKIATTTSAKKTAAPVAKAKEKVDTPKLAPPPAMSQGYAQEIAMQLKLLLSLPEYGEVKVMLRLGAKGEIANVEILESQSTANEKYLLEMLPKLTLPPPPSGDLPLKLTLSNA